MSTINVDIKKVSINAEVGKKVIEVKSTARWFFGWWDMKKSVYDPDWIGGDAFSMDNMKDWVDKHFMTNEEKEAINKPYSSLERMWNYLYKVTFNTIPNRDDSVNSLLWACSSYVEEGKLHRNFDWHYDNRASFLVITKDFKGIWAVQWLDDSNLNNNLIAQLPYHLADWINNNWIMISEHVLYNDWQWNWSWTKTIPLTEVPYRVLTTLTSMDNIETELADIINNLKVPEALAEAEYLLQYVITDWETTYALLPPTSSTWSYVLQDISSNPKLTNFRWVNQSTVVRTELQTRPTWVERYNLMPCDMSDIAYTKMYETPNYLSEFIGMNWTTKDSSDEELLVQYNIAKAEYDRRTRNWLTRQTVHSIVYSKKWIEHLYVQENFEYDYASTGWESITKVSQLENDMHYTTQTEVATWLSTKQDVIGDLDTIRQWAGAWATAVQPADLQQWLATKQDTIEDLDTIREWAGAGATAVQPDDLQQWLATKQDKLPNVINDRYLRTNPTTWGLEWIDNWKSKSLSSDYGMTHRTEATKWDIAKVQNTELKSFEWQWIIDIDGAVEWGMTWLTVYWYFDEVSPLPTWYTQVNKVNGNTTLSTGLSGDLATVTIDWDKWPFKLRANWQLVFNAVPCINASSVVWFYDLVSKTFKQPAATVTAWTEVTWPTPEVPRVIISNNWPLRYDTQEQEWYTEWPDTVIQISYIG